MLIKNFYIDDDEKLLKINIEAENQKEASLLIHVCNRFPKLVRSYGRVGEMSTWAWVFIPLKSVAYNADYFGNEKH